MTEASATFGPDPVAGAPRCLAGVGRAVRSAVVAGLLTGLLHAAGWDGPGTGVALGLALWSLPVVLLAGSVLWEGVHARAAALHSGDWLIKLAARSVPSWGSSHDPPPRDDVPT